MRPDTVKSGERLAPVRLQVEGYAAGLLQDGPLPPPDEHAHQGQRQEHVSAGGGAAEVNGGRKGLAPKAGSGRGFN